MAGPNDTRAAIVQLDDFIRDKSKGGIIIAFTTIEGERGQQFPRIGNTDWDQSNDRYFGQAVVPCDDTPQVGWIWDGYSTFRNTHTGEEAPVASMPA